MKLSLINILAVVVVLALLTWLPFGSYFDAAMIEASLSAAVVRFPLAIVALLISLRALDYVSSIHFATEWPEVSHAKALYLAARFVGVCLLLHAIFS